jgi:hypothetical protein
MVSSSPESLDEESEPSMFTLPSELDIVVVRSGPPIDVHNEAEVALVDSAVPNRPERLFGIFIPRPPIVGEESGEDCSANVKW